jgi:hypothetical protein
MYSINRALKKEEVHRPTRDVKPMSADLRPVTLQDPSAETNTNADNVIGVDESGDSGSGIFATAAVRCTRSDDVALVRCLIDNELQPFKHKSSSIVRYDSLSSEERQSRVEDFLDDLQETGVTWAAILYSGRISPEARAAGCAMGIKKSITNGLRTGDVAHGCGDTAVLHDGKRDPSSDYFKCLRKQIPGHCDTEFEQSICPVHLSFLEGADRTYPQTNAADYIAGYLRDLAEETDLSTALNAASIGPEQFDNSWIDPAPSPTPVYRLEELIPVREQELRSRVIAWFTGKGIPPEPSPQNRDPFETFVEQIDDNIVRSYLRALE